MEANPVLRREVRSRWRGEREYALLFGWLVALCIGVLTVYQGALHGAADIGREQLADLGRKLFVWMALAQMALWMTIATAMASGTVARERESGLLEGLQLSPFKPRGIVTGKLTALAGFMLLVQLTLLPLQCLCFNLGGVAPLEIVLTALLQFAACASCGAIGLACSAWCRRPGTATALALTLVLGWMISSDASCTLSGVRPGVLESSLGSEWTDFAQMTFEGWPYELYAVTNPLAASYGVLSVMRVERPLSLFDPRIYDSNDAEEVAHARQFASYMTGAVSLAIQLLIVLVGVKIATRGTARIWPEAPPPMERRQFLTWHARRETGQKSEVAGRLQLEDIAPESAGLQTELWNTPLVSLLKFANPVLQREARQRLQLPHPRSMGRARMMWGIRLALVVAYIVWIYATAFSPLYMRQWPALYFSLGLAAYLGARAFAREREAGTWEALELSPMARFDILTGKWLPIVAASGVYYTTLLAPSVVLGALTFDPSGKFMWPPGCFSGWLVAMAAFGWAATWGMLISWCMQRAATAVTWTLGTLSFYLMAGPKLWEIISPSLIATYLGTRNSGVYPETFLNPFDYANPGLAIARLQGKMQGYYSWTYDTSNEADFLLHVILLLTLWTAAMGSLLLYAMARRRGRAR